MPEEWWRSGVIYQIYPRSFQDTSGDGIGDLEGVRRRLDYLDWLGVDAIWLSPFYPSPMKDFGYDVADYCDVDPLFGSMADFDRLLADAHSRGMKAIIDLVPNHTSDQHPWFLASRRSRSDPKRDWYLWRDPAPDGGPPNNWLSHFGGSGWTWDEATQQYYNHAFLPEQPDLNWRNPQLRAAMHEVMRFWLARGVDGFRVDVVSHLIKDDLSRDNPPNPAWPGQGPDITRLTQLYSANRPEIHDIIAGLRRVIDAYPDRVLIGEAYLPVDQLVAYYGAHNDGLHFPFNFHLFQTSWRADALGDLIARYEAALPQGAQPNWVLGNHDQRRIAGRLGEAQARIAAMLLLTLRGTPTLYYGDELGIGDIAIPKDRLRDPLALREAGANVGRDPARTPMQWDQTLYAGFSTHEPWLPLTENHAHRNVTRMKADAGSILSLYKNLLRLRRNCLALRAGEWRRLNAPENILAYERHEDNSHIIVALNFVSAPAHVPLPEKGVLLLSTQGDRKNEMIDSGVDLHGDEGVVIDVSQPTDITRRNVSQEQS